ncbi:MAG: chloride channel protein [Rhodothermales bacterium]
MNLRELLKPKRSFEFAKALYPQTRRIFDDRIDWRITGRWMVYSILVGVIGAVGALIFAHLVQFADEIFLVKLIGYQMPMPGGEAGENHVFDLAAALHPTRRWLLFIVPAIGGLISGWLVFTFAPEAEGHGTDAVIKAFHHDRGIIGPRVPLVKALASAVTLGTGAAPAEKVPLRRSELRSRHFLRSGSA